MVTFDSNKLTSVIRNELVLSYLKKISFVREYVAEAYSDSSETSKMELFAKIAENV